MTYKHKKRINISVRTTLNLDNEIMEKAKFRPRRHAFIFYMLFNLHDI